MLKSSDETICWLASRPGAVLVVGEQIARVVAGHDTGGVAMRTAEALLARSPLWFDLKIERGRRQLRLNEGGVAHHGRLAAGNRCKCRRAQSKKDARKEAPVSQQLWTLDIDTKIDGHPWAISVTMSEQSLLTMMVNTWPLIESNVKRAAAARPGQLPHGLIDDVLVLLRCLVLRRLEPHIGPNLKINKG